MSKKIVIIGKDNCTFCKSAVQLSQARKVNFEYKNVPNDLELAQAYQEAGEAFMTFPFIMLVDGEEKTKIGGFQEYRQKINQLDL